MLGLPVLHQVGAGAQREVTLDTKEYPVRIAVMPTLVKKVSRIVTLKVATFTKVMYHSVFFFHLT